MGRRPNAVLAEYFDRGEKLGDTSNRYRHTCKRCGDDFPKGRIDSLTKHLLRYCQALTQEERESVVVRLQNKPSRNSNASLQAEQYIPEQRTLYDLYQDQSALDTLAEVSRHHLDYSTQNGSNGMKGGAASSQLLAEQALIAHLQDFTTPSYPNDHSQGSSTFNGAPVEGHYHPASSAEVDTFTPTTTLLATPTLVQTASAVNQELEAVHRTPMHLEANASFDADQPQMRTDVPNHSNGYNHINGQSSPNGELQPAETHSSPPDIASSMGVIPRANQPKRSHFSSDRRKEVAAVRKTGACLRCRMLKKPCSGGTPCTSCSKLDMARIWGNTCTRQRLVETFSLYSTHLFHTKAATGVSAAHFGLKPISLDGRVEARFVTHMELSMTFKATAYGMQDSRSAALHVDNVNPDRHGIFTLTYPQSLTEQLGSYVRSLSNCFVNAEPSLFLQQTLALALDLSIGEDVDEKAATDEPMKKGSMRRKLLDNVIELWIMTRMLTTPEAYPMQLRYRENSDPQQLPVRVEWTSGASVREVHDIPRESSSCHLLCSQLRAGIEARCSELGKDVINELERRLLQRQRTSQWATFIAAVILLNCVERMTGFYMAFDDGHVEAGADVASISTDDVRTDNQATARHPLSSSWPLDTPPSSLWPQGPRFVDALVMLLRLRNLSPNTGLSDEGYLVVVKDYVMFNGRPQDPAQAVETEQASDWLDPLKMSVSALVAIRDGPLPTRENGLAAWDMKFISRILLSDKMV